MALHSVLSWHILSVCLSAVDAVSCMHPLVCLCVLHSMWLGLGPTCGPQLPWSSGKCWDHTTDFGAWQCMQRAWQLPQ